MGKLIPMMLRIHVDRAFETLPDGYTHRTSRSLLRACCDETNWGILDAATLDAVTDGLIERLRSPDLSYLAYKTETGDESRNWLRYRLWIAGKRTAVAEAG